MPKFNSKFPEIPIHPPHMFYVCPCKQLMHSEAFISIFPLAADDCFQLGVIAYNRQDYYHTVMWLSQALEDDSNETVKTADRRKILDYLAYAMYQVNFNNNRNC